MRMFLFMMEGAVVFGIMRDNTANKHADREQNAEDPVHNEEL